MPIAFSRRLGLPLASGAAALALVLGAVYLKFGGNDPGVPPGQEKTPVAASGKAEKAGTPVADSDLTSYSLRRQRVFYRTTQPAGTLIVSRKQRFLYLVQSNQFAVRYSIGVGPDCRGLVGLFRIKEKVGPESGAGASGANPFGSYALIFGERRAVHETTQPQNVGQSATVGCFHSWTPDIRELYEVARLDERVVVTD